VTPRFGTLLPPRIAYHALQFDPDTEGNFAAAAPTVALPAELERAVPKRQREFIAGRLCAREAMRTLALDGSDAPLGTGANREPLWPDGVVGALTHFDGFAAAAVARRADYRGIGIDGERLIKPATADNVAATIAPRGELDRLVAATGLPRLLVLTLAFSAKESLFKCLFPTVQRYFDFADAELEAIDAAANTFVLALVTTLTPELSAGRRFQGRFSVEGERVMSGIFLASEDEG
jgi:enterobactin synthetase component D